MKKVKIPRIGSFILSRVLSDNLKYSYLGDIEETHFDICESGSKRPAVVWYWGQAPKLLAS